MTDEPAHAPFPYTPEQIRDGMPPGTSALYEVSAGGGVPLRTRWDVLAATAESGTVRYADLDDDGTVLGEPVVRESTWVEFQRHATFPLDATTIEDAVVELPSGRWDCRLYTVRRDVDGEPEAARFLFAKDKPGAPVLVVTTRGGREVRRMTLLSFERGAG